MDTASRAPECPAEHRLADFIQGTISAEHRGEIEAHMDRCPDCSRVLADLVRIYSRAGTIPGGDSLGPNSVSPDEETEVLTAGARGAWLGITRGTQVGRYTALGIVGVGGMGAVYAAYDPELDRKVAVKVLRSPSAGGTRLLREAQALARLSHPNVCAIYDVGTFEGRVFIAMEFVEGPTLRQWMMEDHPWREVLDVFLAAGRGVAAAHEAHLVHRDFKPANVLVGDDGRVRVTDFGLARPVAGQTNLFQPQVSPDEVLSPFPGDLERDLPSDHPLAMNLTKTGGVVGTPAYMAPEQSRGEGADAAADQYSFCVALYEGLYGERPYMADTVQDVKSRSTEDMEPVSRPRCPPAWLRRAVKRGLAEDPDDRWPSMEALLTELRRDPVRARVRYGAVAVSGIALATVGHFAVSGAASQKCQSGEGHLDGVWDGEHRDAIERAFLATGRPFAADAFAGVVDAIDGYTRTWVDMYTDACEATHVRGEQSEELLDLRMRCLDGHLQKVSALTSLFATEADSVVKEAIHASAALPSLAACANADRLSSESTRAADADVREQIAPIDHMLDEVAARKSAGQYRRALTLARSALDSARAVGHSSIVARALVAVADLEEVNGNASASEPLLLDALEAAGDAKDDHLLARILVDLVYVLGQPLGRHDDALQWAHAARAAVARVGRPDDLQLTLTNALATVHLSQGRYAESLTEYQHVLELSQRLHGPEHVLVAGPHTNVGGALYEAGQMAAAQRSYERALEILEATVGTEHPSIAVTLNSLANVLVAEGLREQALELYQRALDIAEPALGPHHPEVAYLLNNMGTTLAAAGRHEQAREYQERSLEILREVHGSDHPVIADALGNLGELAFREGHHAQAREHYQRALELRRRKLGDDHPDTALALHNIGSLKSAEGEHDAALRYHREALEIWEHTLGTQHPLVASALAGLAEARLGLDEPALALPLAQRALVIADQQPTEPTTLAEIRFFVARALWDSDTDRAQAIASARQAASSLRPLSSGHDQLAEIEAWLLQKNL